MQYITRSFAAPCMLSPRAAVGAEHCWLVSDHIFSTNAAFIVNPLMLEFYFQGKMWLVVLLRTSNDILYIFFHLNIKWRFLTHQVSYGVPLKGRYALMG